MLLTDFSSKYMLISDSFNSPVPEAAAKIVKSDQNHTIPMEMTMKEIVTVFIAVPYKCVIGYQLSLPLP